MLEKSTPKPMSDCAACAVMPVTMASAPNQPRRRHQIAKIGDRVCINDACARDVYDTRTRACMHDFVERRFVSPFTPLFSLLILIPALPFPIRVCDQIISFKFLKMSQHGALCHRVRFRMNIRIDLLDNRLRR